MEGRFRLVYGRFRVGVRQFWRQSTSGSGFMLQRPVLVDAHVGLYACLYESCATQICMHARWSQSVRM